MEEFLRNAAERINSMQSYFRVAEGSINSLRNKICNNAGENFCIKVDKENLNKLKVAAVDSGFMLRSFYSVDIMLVKAKAAIFEYENNELKNSAIYPELEIMPKPILLGHALERDELNAARSLHRLKEEIGLANKILQRFKPDVLLLDGSVVPQQADKPRADSELKKFYKEVIGEFEMLYENSQKMGCLLIGVIEDSRGARMKKIIENEIGESFNMLGDVGIANILLRKNERTFVFSYSSEAEKHYILADFKEEWRNKIFAFYLKPSEFDVPIRVEFISENKSIANKIASIILSLSSFHKEYAYPSVLIEADMRARLNDKEINMVFEGLEKRIKGEFALMRRERRPFL